MGLTDDGRARPAPRLRHSAAADVVARCATLEAKRDAGTSGAAGQQVTVGNWLEHWLDNIAAPKVRPTTLRVYRGLVANQIIPKVGHHRLDRLQPEHVERMYAELLAAELSPATVLQVHRVLSRALKVATQRGRVARNVCTLVDAPSVVHVEVQPLTADEARRVLRAAEGVRNSARWSVALALGTRQGEALGLSWDAVDLDARTLRVREALQRVPYRHGCAGASCGKRAASCKERELDLPTGFKVKRRLHGGLVIVEPKSAAGQRTITLPRQLVDALRQQRTAQIQERLAAANVWEDYGLVFTQPNGRPLQARADNTEWHSLLTASKVRKAKLHDARHTAATVMLTMGVPARVVMQILGHSQISLTLGTYSHVMPELAQDAADRVGDALWG